MSHDFASDREFYRQRDIGARMGFGGRPAVLVVDFSCGFTDPSSPLGGDFGAELAATRQVIDGARRAGAPVYFTTVGYRPDLQDAGVWPLKIPSQRVLLTDSPYFAIDPRLGRLPADAVVPKKYASAFFGTNLASLLIGRGIDTLLVAGATTSGCVRASVVDAMQYGFRPMIVRECVGDRAAAPHDAALFDMDTKYGDVISLEQALDYLRGVAPR